MSTQHKLLRFGVFELNLTTEELRNSGTLVKLPPQASKLLALLASRSGEIVSRDEIQRLLWGDETFVDFDKGVNKCILLIRNALNDKAERPLYVETIPRRGYRFLAPVKSKTIEISPAVTESEPGTTPTLVLNDRLAIAKTVAPPPPNVIESKSRIEPLVASVSATAGTPASSQGAATEQVVDVAPDRDIASEGIEKGITVRSKNDTHSESTIAPREIKRRWPAWMSLLLMLLGAIAISRLLLRRVEPPLGVTERQLTANPLKDWVTGAAVSPDGQYVTYQDQTGLYLHYIDSGETHPIALPAELRGRIWNLCWFPRGGKLLADAASSDGWDIWLITVLGEAKPHLLYRHGMEPAISPDGQSIAFANGEFGKIEQEIWVGGVNGEVPQKLVDSGEFQSVFRPAWSPDGRWIAYGRGPKLARGASSPSIEVRPAGGGSAKTLVDGSSLPKSNTIESVALGWSPDWRLVFPVTEGSQTQSVQTKYSLWQVRVAAEKGEAADNPAQLTQWSDFLPADLTITADGRHLSLLKLRSWLDVYVGELGSGGASMKVPRQLTLDDRGSNATAWTLDSQAILFDSTRNGKREIFRQRLNENMAERIVGGPKDVYWGDMSPDGAWFLYWESESSPGAEGTSLSSIQLTRRATGGGSPEKVLGLPRTQEGHPNGFRCSLNPQASSPCVLGATEGKELVFYSLDPLRGRGGLLGKIEISQTAVYTGWDLSPDGSRLAFVDDDKYEGRIEVLTLSDGVWHEIALEPQEGPLQSVSWAADGKGFFVTSRTPNSFNLLHVTFAGKVQPLLRNGRKQWFYGSHPSPDGKYLAFQAQTFDCNVWMIDNF